MNMHYLRFIIISLVLIIGIGAVSGQTGKPLLLKQGNRIPEANLSIWQSAFSLQNEHSFNGKFYKIIQFDTLPGDLIKQQLQASGVDLLSYLPTDAYFASLSVTLQPAALSGKGIRAITALTPDERISPALIGQNTPAYAIRGNNRIEVVVTLFADVKTSDGVSRFRDFGWDVLRTSGAGRLVHVIIPSGELYTLATLPFIQFIEPCDPPEEHDNTRGRSLHRATSAFNPGYGNQAYDGTDVRVLINDDGYIGPHIDFQGRIPFQFSAATGADHGDHCAGTILGAGNLNPLAMGMAPKSDLVVFSASNYPGFDSIYNQYQTLGIRLTSTSYSDGCNAGYTARTATMDEQIRTMPELMHVFSAGNNGTQNCSYGAGSGWGNITGGHKMGKNVIAVANVDYKDGLANSSSRGPAHDGRIKPDVSALGTNVFSTSENNTYSTKTGTSMACPGTTGTMALLYDAYKRHHGSNPQGGLMKAIMMNSADDLGNAGPDFKFGYGRINADRAFRVIEDTLFRTDLISTGDSAIYNLNVPSGTKELRIMLYWTDYEGIVNTTKALVNNLDLLVVAPDSIWLPWVLNHLPNVNALNSPATRKTDTLNNAEQVTLMNPTPGMYQIKVLGTSIPMGPQRFFVNWLITENEFAVTYPHQDAGLVPGETVVVRWDASPSASPFQLDYTTNGGANWDTVSTNIPATHRHFDWVIPSLATGNVQLKLTRGSETFITSSFSIMALPQSISVNWVCADSLRLTWNAMPSAIGFEVLRLGNQYMDSIAFTTTNSIILHGIPFSTPEWFSVRAYGPNGAKGRRSNAIFRTPGIQNCVYTYDIAMQEIVEPKATILSACQTNPPMIIKAIIKNTGSSAVNGFNVRYRVNQGAVVSETIAATLAPGAATTHTFSTPLSLPTANDYHIAVWAQMGNDQFPFNDTMHQLIRVINFPVHPIPYTQTFEAFSLCATTNSCESDQCILAEGWANAGNEVFDHADWLTNRGTTPSLSTGPSIDHTLGTTSGKYLYVESSACFQKQAHLMSPCINLTGSSIPVLSFWYHMNGTGMGSLNLDILSDGVWYENQMPTIQNNQGNVWKNRLVPLTGYIGKQINIRFRATTGATYLSDICLDDIAVVETVGINTASNAQLLDLSPNPATTSVTLSGISTKPSPWKIEFFTQQGQLAAAHTVHVETGIFTETIPTAGLASGIYFVKITGAEMNVTKKLVIGQ